MRTIVYFRFVIPFVFIGALAPQFATAQIVPSLAVHPEKFEFSMSRGATRTEEIKITNTGTEAMPIHLSVVRWEARDEVGGINFTSAPEDPSFDVIQWMALGKNDFILEAGETERVPVTIAVPSHAEPGGKYGAAFIEPTLPEFYFAEDAAHVLPQIGVLFLIDIPLVGLEGPIAPTVAIEEFAVVGRSPALSAVVSRLASLFRAPLRAFAAEPPVTVDILSRTASSFVLRVRNDGITHIRPSGKLVVHNLFGREVARAELSPTTVLPKKIRQFSVDLKTGDVPFLPGFIEDQLALGRYTGTAILEGVGDPSRPGEPLIKTFSYWIIPWQGLLAALIVFGPLGFLTFRFRARIIAALRILFRRPS